MVVGTVVYLFIAARFFELISYVYRLVAKCLYSPEQFVDVLVLVMCYDAAREFTLQNVCCIWNEHEVHVLSRILFLESLQRIYVRIKVFLRRVGDVLHEITVFALEHSVSLELTD